MTDLAPLTLTDAGLLLESMTEGVSLSDEAWIIVYANPAQARMFGYEPGELIGQHVSVQNGWPAAEAANRLATLRNNLQERGRWEGEWICRRKDGSTFLSASRITSVDVHGRRYWMCVARDISAERAVQSELARSEERLRLATEGTGVGTYDVDLSTGQGIFSLKSFEILGLPPSLDGGATYADWRARLHPDDLARVEREHDAAASRGEAWSCEYRIVRANDGAVRWLENFGQFQIQPDGATRSIGVVADVTERKETDETLRLNEARLRRSQSAGRIGSYEWNLGQGTGHQSEGMLALIGLPGPGPYTLKEVLAPVLREDYPQVFETIEAVGRGERRRETLYRIRRPDGAVRWMQDTGEVESGPDGRPWRWVGIIQDVTERMEAEERRKLLVDELNHRVKNTLAVVQSLARQTFRSDAPLEAQRTAFEDRLGALAAAHNLLTATDWRAADLGDVVALALGGHPADRFEISGPEVQTPPSTAVSLMLALHELATNAAKYGALSQPGGVVRLSWRVDDGTPRLLRLRWVETGGPAVSPPQRRGFGTRMLSRALAAELAGQVELTFAPEGVICALQAALPD